MENIYFLGFEVSNIKKGKLLRKNINEKSINVSTHIRLSQLYLIYQVRVKISVSTCLYATQYIMLNMMKMGGEIHMAQASILSTRACLRGVRPPSMC